MKRVSYLPQEQLHASKAWKVYNLSDIDPTRKLMRLICMIEDRLNKSETAEKNNLKDAKLSDLATELTENTYVHACIDCVRKVLEHADPDPKSTETAFPSHQIASLDGNIHQSPMEKAAHVGLVYPEMGELLTRYMTTHQKRLEFFENHPHVREEAYTKVVRKNSNPYYDQYAKNYTRDQLDLWR